MMRNVGTAERIVIALCAISGRNASGTARSRRAIARDAPARLMPQGRLIVEIGPTQGAAVSALFAAQGLTDLRILPDFDGRDRVGDGAEDLVLHVDQLRGGAGSKKREFPSLTITDPA